MVEAIFASTHSLLALKRNGSINSNIIALLIIIFITIFPTVKYNQLSYMTYTYVYRIEGIFVIICMDRISRIIDHTFSLPLI